MRKRKEAHPDTKVIAQCLDCNFVLILDGETKKTKRMRSISIFANVPKKECGACARKRNTHPSKYENCKVSKRRSDLHYILRCAICNLPIEIGDEYYNRRTYEAHVKCINQK